MGYGGSFLFAPPMLCISPWGGLGVGGYVGFNAGDEVTQLCVKALAGLGEGSVCGRK